MKEIIIFPFDLSSEFRDEDYIQGREMDLLQPGCTMEPKSFCSSTKISKGQLISEAIFLGFESPQKQTLYYLVIRGI